MQSKVSGIVELPAKTHHRIASQYHRKKVFFQASRRYYQSMNGETPAFIHRNSFLCPMILQLCIE
jgi:hypothetical protein